MHSVITSHETPPGRGRGSSVTRAHAKQSEHLRPVRVGCSGWNYKSWRGEMYPPGLPARRWLERYAELFDTVEVNTTFYRLISRDAVQRWVQQTPQEFSFAVKASRYLTHVKRLANMREGLARFYERIEPLIEAKRLGPVLWQLPETFHRDEARLAGALAALPAGRHAFEFRHPSWFVPEVYALLREHDAALVIGDRPDRPFQTYEATADWRYVRFHHGSRGPLRDRRSRGRTGEMVVEIDRKQLGLHRGGLYPAKTRTTPTRACFDRHA
jgi:uncharacterized protein YecE (DUF72 family)